MKIYLIGLPGSGKSIFGKEFAQFLNYNFVDLDILISELEQQSIPEIFKEKGEQYFRKKEFHVLHSTLELFND